MLLEHYGMITCNKKRPAGKNTSSPYETFFYLLTALIQIFLPHSAVLLLLALQGGLQLFYGFSSLAAAAAGTTTRFFPKVFIVYHSAPVMHTEEYAPPMIPTIRGAANSLMEETPIT